MMIGRIGPDGRATLIVGVIKEAFRRTQMTGIDDQLLCRFIVGISTLAEEAAVAHEKGHAHKYAISPELMCPAGARSMPETAIAGTGIAVETLSYLLCRQPVFLLLCLLVHEQEQIAGHDGVQRVHVV